jgi:hypothetical protein
MAWLGSRRTGIAPVSLRTKIVASAALATASFLIAPSALAASHPVQVNGTKLKSALLPASSFGSDFTLQFAISSGKHLWHLKAKDHVSTMNCGNFEDGAGFGLFGQTAVATSFVDDNNAITNYPNSEFYYNQTVDQFAGTKAASTFYSQAKAKYAKCKDFTESVPASSVPGSGKMEITLLTMSKTKVGKYQAFQLTQAVTLSESPGFALDLNTLVAVEGTDVFTVVNLSGTNDPVPAGLMLKFINRVKKLR